jgi:TPR repeat protein
MAADEDLVSYIINGIMSRDCISDGIGVLFSWIDESLWAERDFVISVIGDSPSDVITHVPEKLFGDPEFIAALEELYDICEWGRELLDGGEECGMLLILNAAKNGNADAQFQLAEIYNTGDGVEESPAEALKWYRTAAENGSSDAQFSLAEMYRYGDGVEKDFETALLWYKRAAEGGNHDAMSALGFIYYRGDGVEKDYNEAYHWFKNDGFRGLPYFVYADMFFYVDKDYSSAFMLYRAALQQGVEEAGYKMGEMYFYGLGVEQNYDEAFKFLKYYNGEFEERFFDWAPAKVHFMLSEMYANGWGVEKDLQEAAKLRTAAEKGEDY